MRPAQQKSPANSSAQTIAAPCRQCHPTFDRIKDTRRESAALHQLQQLASNSPQAMQLVAMKSMLHNSALTMQGKRQAATGTSALQKTGNKGTDQVVQRAVGFEYELDSSEVTSKKTEPKTKTFGIFGKNEPARPIVDLYKGYVIADFGTFDLSVDSTPNGGFDLEIRIKPVDHASFSSLNGLQGTVYRVLAIIKQLSKITRPVTADTVDGDENVLISGDFSIGSLQATAGLSLEALHAFLSGEMGKVHEMKQKRMISVLGANDPQTEEQTKKAYYTRGYGSGSSALLQKALYHTGIVFPKLNDSAKAQVAAVITSILTVPVTARVNRLPYAKSATTVLARSDYATIFKALPDGVLMDKTRLVNLIMVTLNVYLSSIDVPQAGFDSPIYPKDSIKDSSGLSLTLGEWIPSLIPDSGTIGDRDATKDYLTDKNYPKDHYQGDDDTQLESLGGYGSKTDKGEFGDRLPIFEFRRYLAIPNEDLVETVSAIWELVYKANKIGK